MVQLPFKAELHLSKALRVQALWTPATWVHLHVSCEVGLGRPTTLKPALQPSEMQSNDA